MIAPSRDYTVLDPAAGALILRRRPRAPGTPSPAVEAALDHLNFPLQVEITRMNLAWLLEQSMPPS